MISVEFDDAEVLGVLQELAQRGEDLQPALRDLGEYLIDSTKERFRAGKGPDGAPWARNSPVTITRLASRYGKKTAAGVAAGKKPLIGESKSLSTQIHARVGSAEVAAGSATEYAAVQQFGARKGAFGATASGVPLPWGDIPARPFLGISDADKTAILDIVQAHFFKN